MAESEQVGSRRIESAFRDIERWLATRGYVATDESISPYFGDRYRTYSDGSISIRVTVDRGNSLIVDLAASNESPTWHDMDLFIACMSNVPAALDPRTPYEEVALFKLNLDAVRHFILNSTSANRRCLEERGKERAARLLNVALGDGGESLGQ